MKNSNNLYESLPREDQRGLHKDTYWLKCNSLTTETRLGESLKIHWILRLLQMAGRRIKGITATSWHHLRNHPQSFQEWLNVLKPITKHLQYYYEWVGFQQFPNGRFMKLALPQMKDSPNAIVTMPTWGLWNWVYPSQWNDIRWPQSWLVFCHAVLGLKSSPQPPSPILTVGSRWSISTSQVDLCLLSTLVALLFLLWAFLGNRTAPQDESGCLRPPMGNGWSSLFPH